MQVTENCIFLCLVLLKARPTASFLQAHNADSFVSPCWLRNIQSERFREKRGSVLARSFVSSEGSLKVGKGLES